MGKKVFLFNKSLLQSTISCSVQRESEQEGV